MDKVSAAAVDMFVTWMQGPADIKISMRTEKLSQLDRLTEESAAARNVLLQQFVSRLDSFERALPASVLRSSGGNG